MVTGRSRPIVTTGNRSEMNKKLACLIDAYQKNVQSAVVLMQRSGIQMPYSRASWIEMDISPHGELDGGIPYYKHGAGCEVSFTTGQIDFDFGAQGEVGGFDVWRLLTFAEDRLSEYGFESEAEVEQCFEDAIKNGSLIYSGCSLYYVANAPRLLATDVDCRLPDDMLPSRDQDPILTLYAHYFLAADLMRKNYERISGRWRKTGKLSQGNEVELRVYLSSWLGFLAVTCEGFRDLKIRVLLKEDRPESFSELVPIADSIGRMMKKHSDHLRKYRNNIFHLREDLEVIRNFFANEAERLPWSRELHTAIAEFFSQYRVLCEVHYIINGRKSEMTSSKTPKRRRISSE